MNIRLDDAMELGQLLQFLDDWLSTDHGPVDESLTRLVGCEAYGVESLRDDLARFHDHYWRPDNATRPSPTRFASSMSIVFFNTSASAGFSSMRPPRRFWTFPRHG